MYRRPLEAVQAASVEVVLPLFRAMVDAAESIILKLHEVGAGCACTMCAWLYFPAVCKVHVAKAGKKSTCVLHGCRRVAGMATRQGAKTLAARCAPLGT